MKETVVALNELYWVLLAIVWYEVAGLLMSEVAHKLDTVQCAVIHAYKLLVFKSYVFIDWLNQTYKIYL